MPILYTLFYMNFDFGAPCDANTHVSVCVCMYVNIAQNRKQQNYSYATLYRTAKDVSATADSDRGSNEIWLQKWAKYKTETAAAAICVCVSLCVYESVWLFRQFCGMFFTLWRAARQKTIEHDGLAAMDIKLLFLLLLLVLLPLLMLMMQVQIYLPLWSASSSNFKYVLLTAHRLICIAFKFRFAKNLTALALDTQQGNFSNSTELRLIIINWLAEDGYMQAEAQPLEVY